MLKLLMLTVDKLSLAKTMSIYDSWTKPYSSMEVELNLEEHVVFTTVDKKTLFLSFFLT